MPEQAVEDIGAEKCLEKKNAPRTTRQKLISLASFLLIAFVLVFAVVLGKAYFDGEFKTVESLQAYIDKYGAFGPVILTVFQALQVIIPVLPGFLGCVAGSVMFGPAVGFICNYLGIALGSIAAFFLARQFGKPLIQDLFPSGKYNKWSAWASKSKSYTAFLFMAMLLPLFPDDYLCYLTGVSKMTARKFIWIIILGKPWCILAYSLGFSLIRF
ncbi:MAG: VTT domain-containing protein [Lachnospiraceae bacterium]|nr:VTT domain-containing protein [Lachnospiraceae bacterium]